MYLSNIRALSGLSAFSCGGGTFLTMAVRISVMPIPSLKEKKNIIPCCPKNYATMFDYCIYLLDIESTASLP